MDILNSSDEIIPGLLSIEMLTNEKSKQATYWIDMVVAENHQPTALLDDIRAAGFTDDCELNHAIPPYKSNNVLVRSITFSKVGTGTLRRWTPKESKENFKVLTEIFDKHEIKVWGHQITLAEMM